MNADYIDVPAGELVPGDRWGNGRRILTVVHRFDGHAEFVTVTYKVPRYGVRTDEYLAWRLLPILPRLTTK